MGPSTRVKTQSEAASKDPVHSPPGPLVVTCQNVFTFDQMETKLAEFLTLATHCSAQFDNIVLQNFMSCLFVAKIVFMRFVIVVSIFGLAVCICKIFLMF